MDYTAVSTLLEFAVCETQSCANITIEDDLVLEMEERFDISLNRTTDLDPRITLNPTLGQIVIIDNDSEILTYIYLKITS